MLYVLAVLLAVAAMAPFLLQTRTAWRLRGHLGRFFKARRMYGFAFRVMAVAGAAPATLERATVDHLVTGKSAIRRLTLKNLDEDFKLVTAGVLDPRSFIDGYRRLEHPVQVEVTRVALQGEKVPDWMVVRNPRCYTQPVELAPGVWGDAAYDMRPRVYRSIRRQGNLRTTLGRDQWQRLAMHGDVTASQTGYTGVQGNLTSISTVTATNSGAAFPTTVADAVTASNTTVTSATAAFTNMDIGRIVTGTNIPANTYISAVASATSCTISNTASGSGSGGTLAISRLQGRRVTMGANASGTGSKVYGIIVSNTATAFVVDQWYDPTSATGAAGTTPNATAGYVIGAGGPALWMGLCATGGSGNPISGGHTPVAGDILRQADGLFGDGTATGAASEQNASGLGPIYTPPTFPAAGQVVLSATYTYTGSTVVTLDMAVLCNAKPAAGRLLFLATQLNASAAVSANGDTVTPTWTENL